MNAQKLLLGTLVGAVVVFLLDYVFYEIIVKGKIFDPIPGCSREQPDMLWLIISLLIIMGIFTYIYGKGVEGANRMQQGLRFGLVFGILFGFGMNFLWYSFMSGWPLNDYLIDGVYTTVKFCIAGVAVAYSSGTPDGSTSSRTEDSRGKGSGGGGGDV